MKFYFLFFFIFINTIFGINNHIDYNHYIDIKLKDISINKITPLELKGLIDRNYSDNYILLDVREPYEININNSISNIKNINIPRGLLEFKIQDNLETINNKNIIIVCTSGLRSKLSYLTLKELGVKNLLILEGGIEKWKEECLPTKINSNLLFTLPTKQSCSINNH